MAVLREAVERHMGASDFLPKRSEINRQVSAVLERRESARQADGARKHLTDVEQWKQTWQRERAEERAAKEAEVMA
jgi:hypothetical protein